LIDMGLYRRFYRQKNTSFAGAGLRGIGSSSISVNHTEQVTALQPLTSSATRCAPCSAATLDVRSNSHFCCSANIARPRNRPLRKPSATWNCWSSR